VGLLFVADDAPLAAQERLASSEDNLEAKNDPLRSRLRAEEDDARVRERVELALEKLGLARVRAGDPDRDGRLQLVCHEGSIHYRHASKRGSGDACGCS
jgi:hypothetical protein